MRLMCELVFAADIFMFPNFLRRISRAFAEVDELPPKAIPFHWNPLPADSYF